MAEIIVDIGDNLVETIGCEFKGELVRCKECKWRGEEIESGNPYHWCRLVGVGYEVDDIHFCSYGERSSE